jgi:hypothetical protein
MSVAGTWNLSIATPMGTQSAVLTLTDTDGVVTGTAGNEQGSMDLPGLEADGNRVQWTQEVTQPMKLTVKFDLTLNGDSGEGSAKAGMFPGMKVTATRA